MGLFPQNFIDDLKAQADIVRVVQDSVSLKKSGATYKGLCPFHGEKTPSFHVNSDKGFFHCFGCGVGGDVIKFLELRDKITFPEAVRQLAERSGMTLPDVGLHRRLQLTDFFLLCLQKAEILLCHGQSPARMLPS